MICENSIFKGDVSIGHGTIVHSNVTITASTPSLSCSIGEKNIIEDYVSILNSNIGHGNIVELCTVIENSNIGDFTRISPKVTIKGNSIIGNGCIISPGLVLDGVSIPDNTAVYGYGNSQWRCGPADSSITYPLGEAMRTILLSDQSQQCLRLNFKERDQTSLPVDK